jgi:hypothetical protein
MKKRGQVERWKTMESGQTRRKKTKRTWMKEKRRKIEQRGYVPHSLHVQVAEEAQGGLWKQRNTN